MKCRIESPDQTFFPCTYLYSYRPGKKTILKFFLDRDTLNLKQMHSWYYFSFDRFICLVGQSDMPVSCIWVCYAFSSLSGFKFGRILFHFYLQTDFLFHGTGQNRIGRALGYLEYFLPKFPWLGTIIVLFVFLAWRKFSYFVLRSSKLRPILDPSFVHEKWIFPASWFFSQYRVYKTPYWELPMDIQHLKPSNKVTSWRLWIGALEVHESMGSPQKKHFI